MGLPFVKREPVELDPRKSMTPARRRRILAKSDGHCSYPDCEVTEGLEIDYDHLLRFGLAGVFFPHDQDKKPIRHIS